MSTDVFVSLKALMIVRNEKHFCQVSPISGTLPITNRIGEYEQLSLTFMRFDEAEHAHPNPDTAPPRPLCAAG